METFRFTPLANGPVAKASRFTCPDGATECHICIMPGEQGDFSGQLQDIDTTYGQVLQELDLSPTSAVFRRVFLSDTANQESLLAGHPLVRSTADNPVAISLIEQPPLPEGRIALWAYHLQDPTGELQKEIITGDLLVKREQTSHLWSTNILPPGEIDNSDPGRQTDDAFAIYEKNLARLGANMLDQVIRTWIFVSSVDLNYGEMVRVRRELFIKAGLTPETHYIASTGIAGRRADPRRIVQVEGYALAGGKPEQFSYLTAPKQLGPTNAYGVTFERGVSVNHGDRRHLLISGTASIDNQGVVLHPREISKQTARAFANIAGLLADDGGRLEDIAQMIVYLRDAGDRKPVSDYLEANFPHTPYVLVLAPVCRPEWLVEIECWAIVAGGDPKWGKL